MTALARDTVASDHLVYAWPFPIEPECEVSCGDDEEVVMCPAWLVGDRLGPGRHRWRTPDPHRPVAAFFVRTSAVEARFDMTTGFVIPATGQPIRLRASGSLQVRCTDPGLLIAQFVGLPFDAVNDGILRSVSRSIERMLARLLPRRVVVNGSAAAVTDPAMLPGIVEELVAYNPTAGAVFGVELIQMGQLSIVADDGSSPYIVMPAASGTPLPHTGGNGGPDSSLAETARTRVPEPSQTPTVESPAVGKHGRPAGEVRMRSKTPTPMLDLRPTTPAPNSLASRPTVPLPRMTPMMMPVSAAPPTAPSGVVAETLRDEITQPGVRAPEPPPRASSTPPGAIIGIGTSPIGSAAISGEISAKIPPGGRVLVPGPNGLMQSATVRQLLQGYYELEVGSSGETIWVPLDGVVPE